MKTIVIVVVVVVVGWGVNCLSLLALLTITACRLDDSQPVRARGLFIYGKKCREE